MAPDDVTPGATKPAARTPPRSPSRVLLVCNPDDIHVTAAIESGVDRTNDLIIVRPELLHGHETRPRWARVSRLAAAAHEVWRIRRVTGGTLRDEVPGFLEDEPD